MLARLARSRIRAHSFWSVPHPSLPAGRFPGASARRASTIALPVHQELCASDVERIAAAVGSRPRRKRELRLDRVNSLDDLRDEWSELALLTANIFTTWEWSSLWWKHFGRDRPLMIVACRTASGELTAILPLYRWSTRPAKIVRLIGHGPGDELGPICAPRDRPAVARSLRRYLSERSSDWDLFLGEQLRVTHRWSALIGARTLRREGNPVLHLDGMTWDEYLRSRSSNFRQQVGRRERNLQRRYQLEFRLTTDARQLTADMDTLFALHSARWQGRDLAFRGIREPFHREFAECALERGWLRLRLLCLDGEPVAARTAFALATRSFITRLGATQRSTKSLLGSSS
jgi:CelD/BcsL family acetyltransferase involved in cellulose biosynthesis